MATNLLGSEVYVEGLRELQRGFALLGPEVAAGIKAELRAVAEPVAKTAQELAAKEIRNIGPAWSQMRVGVTRKLIYVAPKQRGRASRANAALRRPNLATLLRERAMQPAEEQHAEQVKHAVEGATVAIAHRAGFRVI